ncbi:hypothetical protein ES703_83717 [subsurface metagenome]
MAKGYYGAGTVVEGLGHLTECPGDIKQYANGSYGYGDAGVARCLSSYHW